MNTPTAPERPTPQGRLVGRARRAALGLGAALATLALAAGGSVLLPWPAPAAWPPGRDVRIYVTSNGMHTELALPVATAGSDWRTTLPVREVAPRADEAAVKYYAFGWGERDFFLHTPTWAEATVAGAVRALFFSEASLVHVTGLQRLEAADDVRAVDLSPPAYAALVRYVYASFHRGAAGVVRVADGYGPDDAFFAADGRYALWRTCNSWTAGGLRQAGVPTPLWAATAGAVMHHLASPPRPLRRNPAPGDGSGVAIPR